MTQRVKGITGVLYDMLKDAIDGMQKHLKKKNKNSSYMLNGSFYPSVEVKEQFVYEAVITTSVDYYDFVDKGVRGHGKRGKGPWRPDRAPGSPYRFKVGPPVRVFEEWIRIKPVDAPLSAAYGMAKNAGRFGLPGTGYIFEGSKAAMSQKNTDALQAAYVQAFEDQLNIMTGDGNS